MTDNHWHDISFPFLCKPWPERRLNAIIRSLKGMKKIAVFLCVLLLSSVCSLFKAKVVPYPTGVIFPVEKDHELSYDGEIIPPIKKEENRLYLTTRKGNIYCIDGQRREILWEVTVSTALASPPYLSEARLYTHDSKNTLYCADREGKILWKKPLMNKITSSVVESSGQVYVGTEEGLFFALDAATGEEIWQFEAGDAVRSNLIMWQDNVMFGCDDSQIYLLDSRGRMTWRFDAGGKTGKTLTVEDNLLFYGTDDRFLHCVNLSRQKKKWRIRSGGAAFVSPVADGKKIFFLCWNCVLYCLSKKNGTILWWNSVPSRSYYRVEVIDEKVVVSSFSPELVCFDTQTGENKGSFDASQEIKSNPVWLAPDLLINLHDPEKNTGKLLFLKKSVKATLTSSTKSPAELNEEITFSARDTGFHLPKYEFSLSRYAMTRIFPGIIIPIQRQDKEVVQEISEQNTWDWFPEEEGLYSVEVVVVDDKEKANAEMPFLIRKEDVQLSLSASLESPQPIGQIIVFTAHFSGFTTPRMQYRLTRLTKVSVIARFPFLFLGDEKIVQEAGDSESWSWTPDKEGMYFVRIVVQDSRESAIAWMAFVINKE
jgi:outer membrane protein assembly factor BamB